jgi:mono/diheme cytochrome c family protein
MIFSQLSHSFRRRAARAALVFLVLLILSTAVLSAPASAQEPLEPAGPPDAQVGLPLFANRCANCHGPEGQGNGELAGNLPRPPRDYTDEEFRRTAVPSSLFQTITDGRPAGAMPPFGPASSNPIDTDSRWDLVAAVFSLGTPVEAIENGRVIYEENCLSCHGEEGAGDGPEAGASAATVPDLSDLRYWYSRSNEMVLASLQDPEIADHTYDLGEDELWDVIDYARTFSYIYADPQAAFQPIEVVAISGQVLNGSTDDMISAGSVLLRAFTPDLQQVATQETEIASDGTYNFEVTEAGSDWVYMTSAEYGDISFSSSPERLEPGVSELEMPIVVFDATEDPSAIQFQQVHMIMDYDGENVQVSEIYVVSNLEQAVFIGESGDPEQGTLQLGVPTGAQNVAFQRSFQSFENFLPATEVIPNDQGYVDTVPVRPGSGVMNLLVSYSLPYETNMTLGHPLFYDTNSATIVLPDIGLDIEGTGWTSEGSQQMGDMGSISSYSHPSLAAGEALSFTLTGRPSASTSAVAGSSVDNNLTGVVIGGIALLLAAVGAVFAVQNWRSEAEEAATAHADQVESMLYAVAALDQAYEAGKVETSQYHERRADLLDQLAANWVPADGR